jgi:hypothetical protein
MDSSGRASYATTLTASSSVRRCALTATTTRAPFCTTLVVRPSYGAARRSMCFDIWPPSSGAPKAETKKLVRLSFCRVVEFQRRGVVHLHAVVRADGPTGSPPPVDSQELARAVLTSASVVAAPHPLGTARWGEQVDVQILDRSHEERAKQVSGYVAKDSTKSSEESGVLDFRIRSAEDLARRRLPVHLRRMVETAWTLGGDDAYASLRLRRHAHSLGYGGYFLSKSWRYSTTLGALRTARQDWQRNQGRITTDVGDRSVSVRWRAVGIGWADRCEANWAESQRLRRQEERRCAAEDFYSRTHEKDS